MTTTSAPPAPSMGIPSAAFPVVIRTRAICSPAVKSTPRNESVALPAMLGTVKVPSGVSPAPKSSSVVAAVSTSENTAPKADTVAGAEPPVPGMENVTSVTLLPIGTKSRGALNAEKVVA